MAEPAHSVEPRRRGAGKSATAFRTISEVAGELDVPQHVLRFWESKFIQVRPMKRGGGRRYYRPEDVDLLRSIRELLYTDGYTIKGVQKLLRDGGVKSLTERQGASAAPPANEPTPISRTQPVVGTDPVRAPAVQPDGSEVAALKAALGEILEELERIRARLRDTLE